MALLTSLELPARYHPKLDHSRLHWRGFFVRVYNGRAMECFNHSGVAARAICTKCGKGLCSDCSQPSQAGMECRDNCGVLPPKIEPVDETPWKPPPWWKRISSRTSYGLWVSGFFVVGAIYGLWREDSYIAVLFGIGAFFLISGALWEAVQEIRSYY